MTSMGNMINQSAPVGWRMGNTMYSNKWHAIMAYLNQPSDYGFYYYDHVWDQVNWSHEPEQTLKALEKQALFLRECVNKEKSTNSLKVSMKLAACTIDYFKKSREAEKKKATK